MRRLLSIAFLVLCATTANAAEESAEEIQKSVMLGAQLASNVQVFPPLRSEAPPVDGYLVPRFGVYVGGARVTDSSPDSVLARLFAAAGAWKTARALAITVQFDGLPEMPILVVERTGNSYKQHSIHNVSVTPSLQYPAEGRIMTVRYRYSTETVTNIAQLLEYTTAISTIVAGAPIAFITPAVQQAGAEIDKILAAAFKVDQQLTFQIGLDKKMTRYVKELDIVFFDRPVPSAGATPMATLVVALDVERSIFIDPDSDGKFTTANEGTILNKKLGAKSAYDYLKDQTNAFVTMLEPSGTADQYYAGCEAIRLPIAKMGLTPPDQTLLLWAATMMAKNARPDKCPTAAERDRMTKMALPAVGAVAPDDYAQFYKPTLDKLVEVFTAGRPIAPIAGDVISVDQSTAAVPDVPVGQMNYFSATQLDEKLAKARATAFVGWNKYGGQPGDFVASTYTTGGKTYQAIVRLSIQQVASGPPAVMQARVVRLSIQPAPIW